MIMIMIMIIIIMIIIITITIIVIIVITTTTTTTNSYFKTYNYKAQISIKNRFKCAIEEEMQSGFGLLRGNIESHYNYESTIWCEQIKLGIPLTRFIDLIDGNLLLQLNVLNFFVTVLWFPSFSVIQPIYPLIPLLHSALLVTDSVLQGDHFHTKGKFMSFPLNSRLCKSYFVP